MGRFLGEFEKNFENIERENDIDFAPI